MGKPRHGLNSLPQITQVRSGTAGIYIQVWLRLRFFLFTLFSPKNEWQWQPKVEGIGKCNRVDRIAKGQGTKENTGLKKMYRWGCSPSTHPASLSEMRYCSTGGRYHGYGRCFSFFHCPWASVLFPIKWGYWNWCHSILVRIRDSLSSACSTGPGTGTYSRNGSLTVNRSKCPTGIYATGWR